MIKRLAGQIRLRENQIFFCLTIIIGVLAGLAAVLFALTIERASHAAFGISPSLLRLLLVPTGASLIAGILLAKVFRDVRGNGIPQTGTAYRVDYGKIPATVPLGKFITGVLSMGSGLSMGPEEPSVQIGAGVASLAGRWLRLPQERIQALVPIGAAAALSAAFNTPLAAVLFALEAIIGDFTAGVIGPALIASVTAVIVERSLLGNNALFRAPAFHLVRPAELLAYAGLGIAGGILSLLFCKGLLLARAFFKKLPGFTLMIQPAMGGLMIGAILIVFPQVMGVGYEYVDQALNGALILKTMLALCAVKLVATIISYASGNAGGLFAPSLYLGAMAGGALGSVFHHFFPGSTADPGVYALVGMGVLFAGIMRAPLTSIVMIFELTQDYRILAPAIVANLLSFMISRYYQHAPIYQALVEPERTLPQSPEIPFRAPAPLPSEEILIAEPVLEPVLEPILVPTSFTIDNVRRPGTRNAKKPARRLKAETI